MDREMAFYADPANLEPAGPAYRRKGPRKTAMIAVRFDPAFVESVRAIAEAEGIAVSTWIRRAAEQARDRAARERRPEQLIPGSERKGERRLLPSSLSQQRYGTSMATAGGSARCAHFSVHGVTSFSCDICGPLTVLGAA